jgi:carotenoid cleavage dioxygenase-like enzyme
MTAPASNIGPDPIRTLFANHLRPNTAEDDYEISEIEGALPRELNGTLFRNGPSQNVLPPEGAEALHLFDGDGYVHALRFEDGRAHHRSRFVRTKSFLAEEEQGRYCMGAGNLSAADPILEARVQPNTNVVHHAGRLFALVENAPPFEIDAKTLEPIGPFDYDGKLLGLSTTAHPKIDGRTGQMVIHGYQPIEPYLSLYVVEPDGTTSLAETMDAPWPGMLHDLAISENHVILPLGPVVFDVSVMAEGAPFRQALSWQPERGFKFGIRGREAGSEIRWFDAPQVGYAFHSGNAYEEDGKIFMDACVYRDGKAFLADLENVRQGEISGGLMAVPVLYEFDLATGECRERQLSDAYAEFPRIDDRLIGRKNRWGYAATGRSNPVSNVDALFTSLMKYDRTGGPALRHELPAGWWTGEPVFAPRSEDAGEDEGFVLSMVYDGPNDRSALQILDAQNFDAEPLARLWLRSRVPLQFHGDYAPGVL